MNRRWLGAGIALAVLSLVAVLYWPVRHGGFVWDDTISLHDEAWLRGDAWKDFFLHNFNGWGNYFRPLVVLLFVLETRAFEVMPGPMHLVSLGIHLADTLLVGMLAWKLCNDPRRRTLLAGVSMLFYGLHPALIEPVDWVGCQFELAVIFFILLGLLLNAWIASTLWRALAVSVSFLLAAGFKEAAAAFPLLLVLFDLMAAPAASWPAILRSTWQRQRAVYAGVLFAAIAYLILRHWALGYTLTRIGADSGNDAVFALARLQKVCLTYLEYLRLIVWPMSSIGPIHPFDEQQFNLFTTRSLAIDAAALALMLGGIYAFSKRIALGGLILAVTIALLPVLNIVPIAFSESLYHDRYATTAVAMACVLLPSLLSGIGRNVRSRVFSMSVPLIACLWLAFAIVNIRVTVPLWSDEVGLWQWALRQHPDSLAAKDLLLTGYMHRNDLAHAGQLADELVAANVPCLVCLLNAANLAIVANDEARATQALDALRKQNLLAYDLRYLPRYILTSGRLLELQNDRAGAEAAYRDAIKADPFDPEAHMALVLLLARAGKVNETRDAEQALLALSAPDERESRRRLIEQTLAASRQ